jgi:integrase
MKRKRYGTVRRRPRAGGGHAYQIVFYWQGKAIDETTGGDYRQARSLLAQRNREVLDGTYRPPVDRTATTIAQWGRQWALERRGSTACQDRKILERLVWSRPGFGDLPMSDWRLEHTYQLVLDLQKTPIAECARRAVKAEPGQTISDKYVANIYGLVKTMSVAARLKGVIHVDPCLLPKGTIKRTRKKTPRIYLPDEVLKLIHSPAVAPEARVFAALGFFAGFREGEICARTWSDYDPDSRPLGALRCVTQYKDRKLKTAERPGERPREVPVHPELARILDEWWSNGWELAFGREPTLDDRIVPSFGQGKGKLGRTPRPRVIGTHTKSSAYKMWRRACDKAGVSNRSLHSTRHTFITWAQRGGANPKHLERVTHNAAGDIIDRYTHLDWDPLCAAVECIRYEPGSATTRGPRRGPRRTAAMFESMVESVQVFETIVEAPGIESATIPATFLDESSRSLSIAAEESPRAETVRDRLGPVATTGGAERGPPSDAELERGIVEAVTLGLADVARALAGRLEERRRGRVGNVVPLSARRRPH